MTGDRIEQREDGALIIRNSDNLGLLLTDCCDGRLIISMTDPPTGHAMDVTSVLFDQEQVAALNAWLASGSCAPPAETST